MLRCFEIKTHHSIYLVVITGSLRHWLFAHDKIDSMPETIRLPLWTTNMSTMRK